MVFTDPVQSNLHKNVLELRSFSSVGGDFGPLGRAKHKHVSHSPLVRAQQNYRPAVILAHGRSQTPFVLKKNNNNNNNMKQRYLF